MEEHCCKLCGRSDSFLIPLTPDVANQKLFEFIHVELKVQLSCSTSRLICGKCIGRLDSWREFKKDVFCYQNSLVRHDDNQHEPAVSSDLESHGTGNSQTTQEEWNPSILQAMSLAHHNPLHVIKAEVEEYTTAHSQQPSLEFEDYAINIKAERAAPHEETELHELPASPEAAVHHTAHSNKLEAVQQRRGRESASVDASNETSRCNETNSNEVNGVSNANEANSPDRYPVQLHKSSNSKNLLIECVKCLQRVVAKTSMNEHFLTVHKIDLSRKSRYESLNPYYFYVCTVCEAKFGVYNEARKHRKVHRKENKETSEELDEELEFEEELDECLLRIESELNAQNSKESSADPTSDTGKSKDDGHSTDDKSKLRYEILRRELVGLHYQHTETDELDANANNLRDIKTETFDSFVNETKKKTKRGENVNGAEELKTDLANDDNEDEPPSEGNTCKYCTSYVKCKDSIQSHMRQYHAQDTLASKLHKKYSHYAPDSKTEEERSENVIFKSENIYNDVEEENCEYNINITLSNICVNHFLVHASSENSLQCSSITVPSSNSLSDDQYNRNSLSQLEDNFQCNICNVYFDDMGQLGAHMKTHTYSLLREKYFNGERINDIKCVFCNVSVKSVGLQKHMSVVHANQEYPIPEPIRLLNGVTKCALCKEQFKRAAMYDSHSKACFIHDMVLRQLKQRADYANQGIENTLEIELKQNPVVPNNSKDFKKPMNEYQMQDLSGQLSKRKSAQEMFDEGGALFFVDNKNYICGFCNLDCQTKLKLDLHTDFHVPAVKRSLKKYFCTDCKSSWTTGTGARNHLKKVHLKVPSSHVLCSHCLQLFSVQREYTEHWAKDVMKSVNLSKKCDKTDEKLAGCVERGGEEEESESDAEDIPYADDSSEEESDADSDVHVETFVDDDDGKNLNKNQKQTNGNSSGASSNNENLMHKMQQNLELECINLKRNNGDENKAQESSTKYKPQTFKELKMLTINTPRGFETKNSKRRRDERGRKEHQLDSNATSRSSSTESGSSSRTTRSTKSSSCLPGDPSSVIKVIPITEMRNKEPEQTKKGNTMEIASVANEKTTSNIKKTNGLKKDIWYDSHGSKRAVHTCKHCKLRFVTHSLFLYHESQCSTGVPTPSGGGVCPICNIYFANIKGHMIVHGNTKHRYNTEVKYIYVYQCPLCYIDMKQNVGKFNKHIAMCKVKGNNQLRCKFCKRLFLSNSNKARHQNICSGKQASNMFAKSKTPLLKCTYCCKHIFQKRENHDIICTEPIEKSVQICKEEEMPPDTPLTTPSIKTESLPSITNPNATVANPASSSKTNAKAASSSETNTATVTPHVINKCERCKKEFALRFAYMKHIAKCNVPATPVKNKEEPTKQTRDVIDAKKTVSSKALSCFMCEFRASSSVNLYNHYIHTHKVYIHVTGQRENKIYSCLYCKKPCNSFLKFNLHGHFHEQYQALKSSPKSSASSVKQSTLEKPDRSSTDQNTTSTLSDRPSFLTTRNRIISRVNVEHSKPTSSNHSTSPVVSSTNSMGKRVTENAKITNSYKNRKVKKKHTKCENCKEYIVNSSYTKHAVQCISNYMKKTRSETHRVMSGYIKKKKVKKTLCIYCNTMVRNSTFSVHIIKCSRINSYRHKQRKQSDELEKPSPVPENKTVDNTSGSSSLRSQTKAKDRKTENSDKVKCPLCESQMRKEIISSHYFYHTQELSWAMYMEVFGLKEVSSNVAAMYCPLCDQYLNKDIMKSHYKKHNKDLKYDLYISLLGFNNEKDFIDFIENKHLRIVTRSKTSEANSRKKNTEIIEQPSASTACEISTRSSRRFLSDKAPAEPNETVSTRKSKRSREDSNEDDDDIPLATLLEIKRPRRGRNVLETSDPIILNENDSELSEASLDDPLADPFGNIGQDKTDPFNANVEEATNTLGEDVIAVFDWNTLAQKPSFGAASKPNEALELKKKRDLEEHHKREIQKKVDAILNKNREDAAKKAAAKEALEKLMSKKSINITKTVPSPSISKTISPTKAAMKRIEPIRTPEKTSEAIKKKDGITVSKVFKNVSPMMKPVSILKHFPKPTLRPDDLKMKSDFKKQNNTGQVTLKKLQHFQRKLKPSISSSSKSDQKTPEKMKSKLLINLKKESNQLSPKNSNAGLFKKQDKQSRPSVPHESGLIMKKIILHKPKKEFNLQTIVSNKSDKNTLNQLRGIKINKKKPEENVSETAVEKNVPMSKVESIPKEIEKETEGTDNDAPKENEEKKPTEDSEAENTIAPQNALVLDPISGTFTNGNSSEPANTRPDPEPVSARVITFKSTFVPVLSPPPIVPASPQPVTSNHQQGPELFPPKPTHSSQSSNISTSNPQSPPLFPTLPKISGVSPETNVSTPVVSLANNYVNPQTSGPPKKANPVFEIRTGVKNTTSDTTNTIHVDTSQQGVQRGVSSNNNYSSPSPSSTYPQSPRQPPFSPSVAQQYSPYSTGNVEYPKPSSSPMMSRSNTSGYSSSNPASPMYSRTPAMSPAADNPRTPSSPMASRSRTPAPGISPSPTDTLRQPVQSPQTYPDQPRIGKNYASPSNAPVKLPPISSIVAAAMNSSNNTSRGTAYGEPPASYINTERTKTYTTLEESNNTPRYSTPSPSPSSISPKGVSLTDNLLQLPSIPKRRTLPEVSSQSVPSPHSYPSTPPPTSSSNYPAPMTGSPNYSLLSTAYPLPAASYSKPSSPTKSKKNSTPATPSPSQPYSPSPGPSYTSPSTTSSFMYPSSGYPNTSSIYSTSYPHPGGQYLPYPEPSHHMPPPPSETLLQPSQGFRPYESQLPSAPYHSSPPVLSYDYGSTPPTYDSGYLPPPPPVSYPPGPAQYGSHPASPAPQYYNYPPGPY